MSPETTDRLCMETTKHYDKTTEWKCILDSALPLSTHTRLQARQVLKSTTQQVDHYLSDYGECNDNQFADVVTQFVRDRIGSTQYPFKISKVSEGKSGDLVLKTDLNDGNSIIIKLVPASKPNEFMTEVAALRKLETLNLETIHFAALVGIGKCSYNTEPHYIIAQEFVPGVPIEAYVKAVAREELFSQSRANALERACQSFKALGTGLSEFHNTSVNSDVLLPSSRMGEIIAADFELAISMLSDIPNPGIDLHLLSDYMSQALESVSKLNIPLGYMYLDTHLGNILVSQQKSGPITIHLIDSRTAYYSFNQGRYGSGMPGFDVHIINKLFLPLRAVRYPLILGTHIMQVEIAQLSHYFNAGYAERGQVSVDDKQAVFFDLVHVAWYITWLLSKTYMGTPFIDMKSLREQKQWVSMNFYMDRLRNCLTHYAADLLLEGQ
jgi:hypothetical protein